MEHDWFFDDEYPTIVPRHHDDDPQITRWRQTSDRDDDATNTANGGRKRETVLWRWCKAIGLAS